MSPHLEKLLLTKYSSLFDGRRGGTRHVGVGDGWYTLLDTLCALICWEHRPANDLAVTKNPDSGNQMVQERGERDGAEKAGATLTLAEFINSLPVVREVKEKSGGLRFYADGCSEAVSNYITFAECLSARVCEMCGSPGERRDDDGWIRTLCDDHSKDAKGLVDD